MHGQEAEIEKTMLHERRLRRKQLLGELALALEKGDAEAYELAQKELSILSKEQQKYFDSKSYPVHDKQYFSNNLVSAVMTMDKYLCERLVKEAIKEDALDAPLLAQHMGIIASIVVDMEGMEVMEHVVKYVCPKLEQKQRADFLSMMLTHAVGANKLAMVKALVKSGATIQDYAIGLSNVQPEIALYLVEHEESGILGPCGWYDTGILEYAVMHGYVPLVNFILEKRPDYAVKGAVEGELLGLPGLGNLDIVRALKRHLPYFDVNHLFHQSIYSMSMLQHMVRHYTISEVNDCKLYEGVKCLVAFGFDIDLKTNLPWNGSENYVTARESLRVMENTRCLPIYDVAIAEGREVWEWNQGVMREMVRWSGCVVMGYGGGSGGDVAGDMKRTNSTGMGSIVGLGKRAVEAVVKFAPAQFEEKLEMGTVRVLRAQAMLEMGHGVTFGDMHHGGYVKYVGTIGEGVTLHRWNATVTCDWHVEVRIKMLGHANGVTRAVHVGGDSYVDHGVSEIVQYMRVWRGDAYDQKLHAQQQWYAETGEVLPTLAVMTQSHHDMITALDNPCQLQHSAHAHDEAAQQYIPQVVPQLMHTSPQHHLQLHIPHDELQQDAGEPHIADFLHSISML